MEALASKSMVSQASLNIMGRSERDIDGPTKSMSLHSGPKVQYCGISTSMSDWST